MMTEAEMVIKILEEECCEVAQRCSKALRFGLNEIQPGQSLTNAERIREEYIDVLATYWLLSFNELLPEIPTPEMKRKIHAKIAKIRTYMDYSRELGIVTGPKIKCE